MLQTVFMQVMQVCVCVCVCRGCYCGTWYCFQGVHLRHLRDSPALWLDLFYLHISVLRNILISPVQWEPNPLCLFTLVQPSVGCSDLRVWQQLRPNQSTERLGGNWGGSLSMPALCCIQNAILGGKNMQDSSIMSSFWLILLQISWILR